jgi:tRNA 2-thiouridine synthesizing protein D
MMTIILGEPPYGQERAYTALRFAQAALDEGHDVNMFLFEDAVYLTREDQQSEVTEDKSRDCRNLIAAIIARGAQIKACGVCARERNMDADRLIEGATIGAMQDLIGWVAEGEKVVSF